MPGPRLAGPSTRDRSSVAGNSSRYSGSSSSKVPGAESGSICGSGNSSSNNGNSSSSVVAAKSSVSSSSKGPGAEVSRDSGSGNNDDLGLRNSIAAVILDTATLAYR